MDKEESARLSSVTEEESSTISSTEKAQIRDEVRSVVNQQFAQARAKLETNLVTHVNTSKSGNATADIDVIDLISQSVVSLQKSQPSVLPGSPISVANTPSHAGNGGSVPGFFHLLSRSHPSPPPPPFSTMQWKPKNHRVSVGEAQRMSIRGPPLWITISLSWVVVMHNRSRTL